MHNACCNRGSRRPPAEAARLGARAHANADGRGGDDEADDEADEGPGFNRAALLGVPAAADLVVKELRVARGGRDPREGAGLAVARRDALEAPNPFRAALAFVLTVI